MGHRALAPVKQGRGHPDPAVPARHRAGWRNHLPHRPRHKDADAPVLTVAHELLREDLHEVLGSLSPRERDVLRLRFGMDDGRQRTLEEVGQLFGVTRERIRQIEAKALRKLRHPNRSKKLKEYVEV